MPLRLGASKLLALGEIDRNLLPVPATNAVGNLCSSAAAARRLDGAHRMITLVFRGQHANHRVMQANSS